MEINSSFSPELNSQYIVKKTALQTENRTAETAEKKVNVPAEKLTEEKIQSKIEKLNSGVEDFNIDLRFKLHRETDTLMVRLLDIKTNEIIKEYPPEELLDKKAKIREFIGMILDDGA